MRASDRYRSFERDGERYVGLRSLRDAIACLVYMFGALASVTGFHAIQYSADLDAQTWVATLLFGMAIIAFFVLCCLLVGGARPALVVGLMLSYLSMSALGTFRLGEWPTLALLAAEHIGVLGWCVVRRPTTRRSRRRFAPQLRAQDVGRI